MFLRPVSAPDTLDVYPVRRSIRLALEAARPWMHGTLLDVGCGNMPYKPLLTPPEGRVEEYIGLDLADPPFERDAPPPDLLWDGRRIPLSDSTVDCTLITEVLEHCPDRLAVLSEVGRVLRPGGHVFLTTPFLFPLHEVPWDEARPTPFALRRELEAAGFAVERLASLGGWDQSLAQMIGLSVRTRPMRRRSRAALSLFAWPVVEFLLRRPWDSAAFRESQMITGIWALARRRT